MLSAIAQRFLFLAPNDETARSIGVGLAPDDDMFEQPYLYITPWPRDRVKELTGATAGLTWQTGDYFGLTGRAEEIMLGSDAFERLSSAIQDAIKLSRTLLGP